MIIESKDFQLFEKESFSEICLYFGIEDKELKNVQDVEAHLRSIEGRMFSIFAFETMAVEIAEHKVIK